MEAVSSPGTSVDFYWTAGSYIAEPKKKDVDKDTSRSDFMFHFCRLCAASSNVHPFSLYCHSQYMFRPNLPSTAVQVVYLR
jgi:hypothetical protein